MNIKLDQATAARVLHEMLSIAGVKIFLAPRGPHNMDIFKSVVFHRRVGSEDHYVDVPFLHVEDGKFQCMIDADCREVGQALITLLTKGK